MEVTGPVHGVLSSVAPPMMSTAAGAVVRSYRASRTSRQDGTRYSPNICPGRQESWPPLRARGLIVPRFDAAVPPRESLSCAYSSVGATPKSVLLIPACGWSANLHTFLGGFPHTSLALI